jgi:chromosomal replication initiator protein
MKNNLSDFWSKVLSDIEKKVSHGNFIALFKNTSLVSLDDNSATISTPSAMVANMLRARFLPLITETLKTHSGKRPAVTFVIKASAFTEQSDKQGPLFSKIEQAKIMVGHLPRVRPDYTFENFAVSASNQLAFVSAKNVASHIGRSYNPLFIYGPVGVGKTHLMHAIANSVYAENPQQKIIYITSEEFTNEVVEAIRTNDTARMKKRFRSANVLLIDDIQFIEGKERVQEELFHTFNFLIDSGSQICLSSDRPPEEIKKLEKRLSSRFAGGLTVDIDKPDLELKTAIIGIKAQKYGVNVPNDVAMFLASLAEDTRSLEGLLLKVITLATTRDASITLSLAKEALGERSIAPRDHIHAEDVIHAVCEYYRIKPTQLKGPKREASLVKARQACMYILKKELGLTHAEIGNLLGGRDHTTVMHGVEKIESLVDKKATILGEIMGITKSFRE